MKSKKHPNINISLYDGDYQSTYECVGEVVCRFALCSFMPPQGDDQCFFKEYGSCRCPQAQQMALEAVLTKIKRELKMRSEEAA